MGMNFVIFTEKIYLHELSVLAFCVAYDLKRHPTAMAFNPRGQRIRLESHI